MNSTSCSTRFDSIAARSPARSSAGPEVTRSEVPSSAAMIIASEVLPRPGGPGQQDVIRCAAAVLGALEHQLQLLANPGLADELTERPRPQAGVDVPLADGQGGRNLPVEVSSDSASSKSAGHFLPNIDSAKRSALVVLASGSLASTLSVASSACLTAKPRPTSASTTGPRTEWPLSAAAPDGVTAPILSRRLSAISSAVFLPTFGIRVSAVMSPSAIAPPQRGPVVHRQRAKGDARPDARHREQRQEQVAGVGVRKAVQRHRILAHDHRRDQPGLAAAVQCRQCRRGRHDLVSDACRLDDDVVEGDVDDLAANGCDHRAAFAFALIVALYLRCCSAAKASAAAMRAIIGARQQ